MHTVSTIQALPANFGEFVDEVARALGELYGPEAASEYSAAAPLQFGQSVQHPAVGVYAAETGGETAGLLLMVRQGPHVTVPFVHVLQRFAGQDVESALVRQAVADARAGDAEGIVAEFPAFGPLAPDNAFADLGFRRVERMVMLRDAAGLADPAALTETDPLLAEDGRDAARILVEAYRGKPGRDLHLEVRSEQRAQGFIESVTRHGFGRFEPACARLVRNEGVAAGVILGARMAPGVGFVLHVAVRPGCQNRGVGARLLRALAAAFHEAGHTQIGLGVTLTNPAVRLYERLGFHPRTRFPAYIWWR